MDATTLSPEEGALFTSNYMNDLDIRIPEGMDNLGPAMVYLAACMVRWHQDPKFVQRQIAWFTKLPK